MKRTRESLRDEAQFILGGQSSCDRMETESCHRRATPPRLLVLRVEVPSGKPTAPPGCPAGLVLLGTYRLFRELSLCPAQNSSSEGDHTRRMDTSSSTRTCDGCRC